MVKVAVNAEDPGIRAVLVNAFVVRYSERCKCEGRIVLCYVVSELNGLRVPASKESTKRLGRLLQRLKRNLAMIAASAEGWPFDS